ncbi:MAG: winged helix-turn-helix domain-containing protein [Nitrososphaeraceae archaeon]
MKAKYRDRTEIIASVLEATKGGGASKTKIMFTAYLSYEQLKEYLKEILDKELLAYDFHTRTYNITPKGIKFLQLYTELEKVE